MRENKLTMAGSGREESLQFDKSLDCRSWALTLRLAKLNAQHSANFSGGSITVPESMNAYDLSVPKPRPQWQLSTGKLQAWSSNIDGNIL